MYNVKKTGYRHKENDLSLAKKYMKIDFSKEYF